MMGSSISASYLVEPVAVADSASACSQVLAASTATTKARRRLRAESAAPASGNESPLRQRQVEGEQEEEMLHAHLNGGSGSSSSRNSGGAAGRAGSLSSGANSDARSSSSDESASLQIAGKQTTCSSSSSSSDGDASRKQRARKRRLQQQRTRKRRQQQQQQLGDYAGQAAHASAGAAKAQQQQATGSSSKQKNKDNASNAKTTSQQQTNQHQHNKQQQQQDKQPSQQRESIATAETTSNILQTTTGKTNAATCCKSWQSSSSLPAASPAAGAATPFAPLVLKAAANTKQQQQQQQPNFVQQKSSSSTTNASSNATKQQQQQSILTTTKKITTQDQSVAVMSIGAGSNSKKSNKQLEISAAAKRTSRSESSTSAGRDHYARSSAIIDRLIIPAANLNLNYQQQKHQQQQQQQIQYSPDYIEQQLDTNGCCCWERDPNNREFCQGQLSQLGHCHEISQPPRRSWIETSFDVDGIYSGSTSSRQDEFSVLSYNVLCDRMARPHLFPSAPYSALSWTYRRSKILDQLRDYDADIVALQELEWEHFDSFFKPRLASMSYEGIFEPKSRYKTMVSEDMIRRVDGCAIFYKQNKFKLVEKHLLEFKKIAIANANGNHPMINRVMTKDNIGLVAILELLPASGHQQQRKVASRQRSRGGSLKAGEKILVCNTHIHWNPEDCDVKLMQTIMLMDELGSIVRQHNQQLSNNNTSTNQLTAERNHDFISSSPTINPSPPLFRQTTRKTSTSTAATATKHDEMQQQQQQMPLILLGDFNSMPNSGVTDYLINGEISSSHQDFKDYRYSAIGSGINHQLRRQSSPAWCNYTNNNNINNTATSEHSPIATTTSTATAGQTKTDETFLLTQQHQLQQQTTIATKHFGLTPSLSSFPALAQSTATVDSTSILSSSPSTSTSSVDSACYSSSSSPVPVLNYSHPFRLTSAYEKNIVPFTNYTQQFRAIIDYIFFSNESLQLLGLLGPLDKNWFRANQIRTLPQPHVPSDHLPLLVKFRLQNGKPPADYTGGDCNGPTLPIPLSSSSNHYRQQQHRNHQHHHHHHHQQQQQQHKPISSMRYNGTLHVSRPSKRLESVGFMNCIPARQYINNNQQQQQQQQHQKPLRVMPVSKWSNKNLALARTTSYSPSSNNKYDQK